ncbi:MAG: glycosyltransferase family A protein [Alphaproteobacteria bacterium]|nr:glycosyltransferase family A protein [Alphaproteobacteria bacterium]
MAPRPSLSVVIPTYNRPELLARCLEGFAGQTVPPESLEIVIVDDGSDAPLDPVIAAFDGLLNLRLERRDHGAAAARNVGVVLSSADHLILFDDDQSPLPDMAERCLAFHRQFPDEEDFRMLRVVPDTRIPRSAVSFAMFEATQVFHYPSPGRRRLQGGFWGGAITCKRSIFRYGLFNPDYVMAEDAELGMRIDQWLHLVEHLETPADALQLRTLTVKQLLRRWCAMGYYHLVMQRDFPRLIEIGGRRVYRDAEKIIARATPLIAAAAELEKQAVQLGELGPGPIDQARSEVLAAFLEGVRVAAETAQCIGWLAARHDEPLSDALERNFV